nr:MAG TPA: hypothetical protein [Caudoviricetes sp.]
MSSGKRKAACGDFANGSPPKFVYPNVLHVSNHIVRFFYEVAPLLYDWLTALMSTAHKSPALLWHTHHLSGYGSAICSHSISFYREPAISKVWSTRPRSFQLPLRLKQIIGNLLLEFNS